MEKLLKFISALLLTFYSQNISAQDWFPLEIGNRWDYFVQIDIPGSTFYDTLSIEIVDQVILPNNLTYYKFSESVPYWSYQSDVRFMRSNDNKIYYFNFEDSTDCLAFRFDLGIGNSYVNCNYDVIEIENIDSTFKFGIYNLMQWHSLSAPATYIFSNLFGIFEYFNFLGLTRYQYNLKGCIISGNVYGELLVSGVENMEIPEYLKLFQNFPNPFNPTTKIKFTIPQEAKRETRNVTLKIYDILGREVATLVNEYKPAGEYEVDFNVAANLRFALTSGVYFYQLKAGDYTETKKMILLK